MSSLFYSSCVLNTSDNLGDCEPILCNISPVFATCAGLCPSGDSILIISTPYFKN